MLAVLKPLKRRCVLTMYIILGIKSKYKIDLNELDLNCLILTCYKEEVEIQSSMTTITKYIQYVLGPIYIFIICIVVVGSMQLMNELSLGRVGFNVTHSTYQHLCQAPTFVHHEVSRLGSVNLRHLQLGHRFHQWPPKIGHLTRAIQYTHSMSKDYSDDILVKLNLAQQTW